MACDLADVESDENKAEDMVATVTDNVNDQDGRQTLSLSSNTFKGREVGSRNTSN